MPDTIVATKRGCALPAELREQARLMVETKGLTLIEVSRRTGVKYYTVAQWAKRGKWVRRLSTSEQQAMPSVKSKDFALRSHSNRMKQAMSHVIVTQAEILAANPGVKVDDLRTTPDGQGTVALAKALVDAGSSLYGWDSERPRGLVAGGLCGSLESEEPIDVETVDQPVNKPDGTLAVVVSEQKQEPEKPTS